MKRINCPVPPLKNWVKSGGHRGLDDLITRDELERELNGIKQKDREGVLTISDILYPNQQGMANMAKINQRLEARRNKAFGLKSLLDTGKMPPSDDETSIEEKVLTPRDDTLVTLGK